MGSPEDREPIQPEPPESTEGVWEPYEPRRRPESTPNVREPIQPDLLPESTEGVWEPYEPRRRTESKTDGPSIQE